jgi:uncharacterized protein YcaQ
MASKNSDKPLHQGGRTLAKMGRKPGRSETSHKRRKVWTEGGGDPTKGKIREEGTTPQPKAQKSDKSE